jgi:large subunit ribosomal protein L18
MDAQKLKHRRQLRRRRHVRKGVVGTAEKPRLSVFRSSKHIYAQLIDDLNGVTLAAASSSSKELRTSQKHGANIKAAVEVGKKLGEVAVAKGIKIASFDRGHYRYHGRIKALAEAATIAGLKCTGEPKPPEHKKEKVEAKPEAKAKSSKGEKGEKAQKSEKKK